MHRLIFVASLACLAAIAAELPVRQVILYKHGVGFFEREGQLAAGESARLDFKAGEMNDVLKSLTIGEKGAGKITGLRYDSSIPLQAKLAEFPISIEDDQPLTAALDRLKGARVEITLGSEKLAGLIVSARTLAAGKEAREQQQITLLLDSGDLRIVELAPTSTIHFSDPKIQSQFRDYLAAVAGARSKDKRSLYIDSADSKSRQVVASYMIPAPVWKSSYRLIFDEKSGKPTLEGWAIVDNVTGEDWTNVRMSLISGRPISFISALYEPKYIQRVTADLAEDAAIAPTVYSGSIGRTLGALTNGPNAGLARPMAPQTANKTVTLGSGSGGGSYFVNGAPPRVNASTVPTQAEGRDLGDLFEYAIPTPVNIKKNESAMLPFLQQEITGRKLLIYSDSSLQNPFNAAELTNSTGKTLDGGPITVFVGGVYAGEALVETFKAKDKRLINYAVDLGTRVTTAFDTKLQIIREIHASRGVLTATYAQSEIRAYTIRNVDAQPKTLIIEHPVRPQYTLLSAKPAESTAKAYRFELKLAPNSAEKLPVEEERVFSNTLSLSTVTLDETTLFLQNKALSDAGRRSLEQLADARRRLADLAAQIKDLDTQLAAVTHDQERTRQNIQSLNQVSGQQQQVEAYARKLSDQENQIAKLRDQQGEAQQKQAAAKSNLDSLLEKITF